MADRFKTHRFRRAARRFGSLLMTCCLALALGWGPVAGLALWLAWVVAPILWALLGNLVRNRALARKLSELEELIASCARDRAPFRLTHYAEELAGAGAMTAAVPAGAEA